MALASAFSGLALGCGCSHLSGRRLQTAHPARLARPAAPALVECAHKKGGAGHAARPPAPRSTCANLTCALSSLPM